ncbi:uncharacterized protein [Littorina saxatilis]|uniref:BZIP domain-containing protein n=1 Tax=Littorina saxatilis TaxID=31220 RepID=A0AAN9ATJ2_9CAEN
MADTFDLPQLPEFFDVDSMVDESLTNTCTLFEENLVDDSFPVPSLFDSDNFLSSVVQVQKTQEKSPFHESDSGVSEVSDFCGGSPSRESAIMLDEMLDNMKSTSFLVDTDCTDQDIDLMNYLGGNDDIASGSRKEVAENAENHCPSQSGRQTRMSTRSKLAVASSKSPGQQASKGSGSVAGESQKRGMPRVILRGRRSFNKAPGAGTKSSQSSACDSDESDIEVDDGESASTSTQTAPRGSLRVGRPGSTLPSSSTSPTTSTNCNVTSVKIVRVLNAGKSSTPEEDINRALDDRNRKNAEIAKANRLKKKAHVENLEKEVEDGRLRIDHLETQLNDVEEERDACHREIHYLRSVLANQSALAGLLKNIPNMSGATLSSQSSQKRVAELDHSYGTTKKSRSSPSQPPSTAGVCLHVDKGNVSLEFCHHCAENSARSSQS